MPRRIRDRGDWYLIEHGGHCSVCDVPFACDVVMYMVQAEEHPYRGTVGSAPICAGCLSSEQPDRAAEIGHKSICEGCGRTMVACVRNFRKRFCSTSCQMRSWKRRHVRERPTVICTVCTKSFRPSRGNAKFCSGACRQKAYRRRAQHRRYDAPLSGPVEVPVRYSEQALPLTAPEDGTHP
jgi:hypothetical protein